MWDIRLNPGGIDGRAASLLGGVVISWGRLAAVTVSRSSMATTRSMTFSSSRTFPGQP